MIDYRRLVLLTVLIFSLAACNPSQPATEPTPEIVGTLRVPPSGDAIRVGVLAIRSAVAANAQYGGIVAYLEEVTGQPFILVPLTQEQQFTLVEAGELEFTFNNPLSGVQVQRLYGTEFLATLKRTNTGTFFSGVIIVRADSGIESVEDLRGADGTCVAFQTAAGGCNFQVFHLLQQGLDPFTDFTSFTETPSQDNIVLGVLNGTYDVGFIRTGQLEKMVDEGTLLSLDDIRIMDRVDSDFYYPHSTILYPEWPFAALETTDSELVQQVKDALLHMPADHPALVAMNAEGFVEPVDYTAITDLIGTLQLRSSDAPSTE